MPDPTAGELYNVKRLDDANLSATVTAWLEDRATGPQPLGNFLHVDVARAVAANRHASDLLGSQR